MGENSTVAYAEFQYPPNSQIPSDLFVSKQRKRVGARGFLTFADSSGNLVYTVQKSSGKSSAHDHHCVKLLSDSSGNALYYIIRVSKGSWQGFRENDGEKEFIFTVDKTADEYSRTEFKVLLVGENNEDPKTELQMKGSPFKRACTIYKGDSIVAQTSLMHTLGIGKHFVPRSRFQATIFPGFADRSLVASLVSIYFDGRKLWI